LFETNLQYLFFKIQQMFHPDSHFKFLFIAGFLFFS